MQSLGFDQAERTLDPTFLLSCSKWDDLADDAKMIMNPGYVLGYFLGKRPLGREILRKIGKDRRIVLLPHIKGYVSQDEMLGAEKLYDVGVPEFLNLIRGADCVVTDSFHAAAFSVMFHRPFYVVERHEACSYSTNSRVLNFLSMIGLEERMLHSSTHAGTIQEIDYRKVDAILCRERERTIKYLRNSLTGVK